MVLLNFWDKAFQSALITPLPAVLQSVPNLSFLHLFSLLDLRQMLGGGTMPCPNPSEILVLPAQGDICLLPHSLKLSAPQKKSFQGPKFSQIRRNLSS